MEIKKNILLSLEDYTDFNYFHVKKRLIVSPIIVAACILIVLMIGFVEGDPGYMFTESSSGVVLFICLAVCLLLPLEIKFIAKKQYNTSNLRAETEFVIDGAGVRQSNQFGNSNVGWAYLFKAAESKKSLFFYISKAQAFIMPKRYLSPYEIEGIRSLIKSNMAPKKYRLLEDAPGEY